MYRISGGVVYIGSQDTFPSDHKIEAVDAETGELLWRFDSDDGEFYQRPVISGGVVYLMEQYTDGLFALDSETGELLWNNPLVDQFRVSEGTVYATEMFLPEFYTLDGRSGEELGRFEVAGHSVMHLTEIQDGTVYGVKRNDALSGHFETYMFALDLESDELLWSFRIADTAGAILKVSDGVAYGSSRLNPNGTDYSAFSLDAGSGDFLWSYEFGSAREPELANGTILVVGGSVFSPYRVLALDAEAGELRWSYDVGTDGVRQLFPHPDGIVYVAAGEAVEALDIHTGERVRRYDLGGEVSSIFSGSDGTLRFLVRGDRGLSMLEPRAPR